MNSPHLRLLLVTLTFALCAGCAFSATWMRDWPTAQAAAQQSGKIILVYIYQHGHPACVEMNKTLADDAVGKGLEAFELLGLNGSASANRAFCEAYKVGTREQVSDGGRSSFAATPAYLFLDAKGTEYLRGYGFYPPEQFLKFLTQARQAVDLQTRLAQEPTNALLHLHLGQLYYEMERDLLARPLLEKAIQLDPGNRLKVAAEAELDLLILSIPDDPALAFRQLVAYCFNHPETSRMLEIKYYMAVAQIAAGKTEQAEKILLDFAAIPPGEAPNWNPDYRNPWTVKADFLLRQLRELQAQEKPKTNAPH